MQMCIEYNVEHIKYEIQAQNASNYWYICYLDCLEYYILIR